MPLRFKVTSVKRVRPGSRMVVGTGKVMIGNRHLKKGDSVTFSGKDGMAPFFKVGQQLTGSAHNAVTGRHHIAEVKRPQGTKNRSQSRRT